MKLEKINGKCLPGCVNFVEKRCLAALLTSKRPPLGPKAASSYIIVFLETFAAFFSSSFVYLLVALKYRINVSGVIYRGLGGAAEVTLP